MKAVAETKPRIANARRSLGLRFEELPRPFAASLLMTSLPFLHQITRTNRQPPHALAGGRKDCVCQCWRDRRHTRLADACGVFSARNNMHFNFRRFEDSQHLVVVEISLLHAAI